MCLSCGGVVPHGCTAGIYCQSYCELLYIGVEKSTAQGLVNRLEREGFISGVKGKRVNRIVYKDKLNDGMSRFMNNKTKTKPVPETDPNRDKGKPQGKSTPQDNVST